MQIGSTNLTQKCSTMSPDFGVKWSNVKVTRNENQSRREFLHSCECWLLLVIYIFTVINCISALFKSQVHRECF